MRACAGDDCRAPRSGIYRYKRRKQLREDELVHQGPAAHDVYNEIRYPRKHYHPARTHNPRGISAATALQQAAAAVPAAAGTPPSPPATLRLPHAHLSAASETICSSSSEICATSWHVASQTSASTSACVRSSVSTPAQGCGGALVRHGRRGRRVPVCEAASTGSIGPGQRRRIRRSSGSAQCFRRPPLSGT